MRRTLEISLGRSPRPRVCGYFLLALAPRDPALPRKEEPSNCSTASRSFRHAPSAADSSLTCGALATASISFPRPTMKYRIKYNLYTVNADSIEEAKKKAVNIIGNNLDELVSVEKDEKRLPFWRLLFLGH